MDTKVSLASAMTAIEQAQADIDAERAATASAWAEAAANVDRLKAQIVALQAQVAALQADANTLHVTADATGKIPASAGFQAAIDKCPVGGTVVAGKGTFLIDATKPVMLKSGVTLDLTDATLAVQPNNAPRYYLVRIGKGSHIKGGHLIGDRLHHTYTAGSTHEWGYGIATDDDCTIDGTIIEQFTGDGICLVGDRVKINGVTSTNNRRQAMSVFSCTGLRVSDSEFSNTGAYLTDGPAPNGPCAGVDIEPDKGSVTDAVFEGCTFTGNRVGFLAWLRAEVVGKIDVTLKGCTISGNSNGVWAKDAGNRAGTIAVSQSGNTYSTTKGNAIKADAGSVIKADGETFSGISAKYAVAQVNGGKAIVTGAKYQ